ncbi:keratin, type I cytoskeletal 23 [Alligator mississippiensis]|nr:keratin, type I cytoskeletal 23 [Alligator mississippiensis]
MSSSQGPFQFSSGSLRSTAKCNLAHIESFYRPSSTGAGVSSMHASLFSTRPPGVGASWGSTVASHGDSIFLGGNEKQMMQNLNDRLAAYLDKVRSLEAANAQLESCIMEWHKKRSHGKRYDFNQFEQSIADMQGQIQDGKINNASVLLQIDNAKLASEEFRLKYEAEKYQREGVQFDIENLRKELDNLTIVTTDLEMEIEGLREEHILRKKDHEADMHEQRSTKDVNVNVKVKATPPEDLTKILAGIREDYEAIIEKNLRGLDVWYKEQTSAASLAVTNSPEQLQNNDKEIKNLKRNFQALEIELQAQLSKKHALENTLSETRAHYASRLQNIQEFISKCEEELSELRHDVRCQSNKYKVLLGIKTRLEREISTYQLLLEGRTDEITRNFESSAKEHTASTDHRLKTVVQDSVDGQVVSTTIHEIHQQE